MNITQHDIAKLSDREVKMWAVKLNMLAATDSAYAPVVRKFCEALVHAMRERRTLLLVAENEMLDDDDMGAIVEEADTA